MEKVSKQAETTVKRLNATEYAYHFMKKYEWLRLEAYHDWWRQRSIGYGTHSYYWEKISYSEAERRYKQAIEKRAEVVISQNKEKNSCQQWALLSLYYNCPTCYHSIYKNPTKYWFTSHSSVCTVVEWKRVCKFWRGLYNRRVAERELYNTCND